MEKLDSCITAGTSAVESKVKCFTCDQEIIGAKVGLVNSVTAHSNTAIPVKISELIGDDFLVVITADDFICKRCNVLFNLMDRLQNELNVVQNALSGYIKTKYNLQNLAVSTTANSSIEVPVVTNGVSNDSSQLNNSQVSTPNLDSSSLSNSAGDGSSNRTTTKVYKCGFCDYQSKDLDVVKGHMRVHVKNENKRGEKRVMTPVVQKPIKRKLFRCQVCSASYFDRKSCLNHIKANHTTTEAHLPAVPQQAEQPTNSEQLKSEAISDGVNPTMGNCVNNEISPAVELSSEENKESEDKTSSFNHNDDVTILQNDENTIESDIKPEVPEFSEKLEETNAVEQSLPSDNVDSETNSKTLGLDIEAMLAELHSDTNNANCDTIPEPMET